MKRIRLIISGDVQGVGFRAWVLRQADNLQLMGWVKNRDDGSVEVVAEGPMTQLTELVKRCGRGPDVAWVQNATVEWSGATAEFNSFEVIY